MPLRRTAQAARQSVSCGLSGPEWVFASICASVIAATRSQQVPEETAFMDLYPMFVCQSGANNASRAAPVSDNHKGNEWAAKCANGPEPVFVLAVGIVKNRHGPLVLKNRSGIREAVPCVFLLAASFSLSHSKLPMHEAGAHAWEEWMALM